MNMPNTQLDASIRHLLIVDPCEQCTALLSMLRDTWHVKACTLAEAHLQTCDVGIIRLHANLLQHPEALKQLLSSSNTYWIAVVSDEPLEHRAICEFISGWFFDYHTLPFDMARMRCMLGRAFGMARLRGRTARHSPLQCRDQLIGESQPMNRLRKLLSKLATTNSPVLVRGESGTGKELVARTLHRQSRRADQPFIAINCGAIAEGLIQSELFGHEKGAFTGASQRKIGRIEAANGGTLFLDEIGDLPLDMQANLLRFLQEKNIERVGALQPIPVDVRVIAATHVDLERAVSEGRFREDLYYRLNVMQLKTPSLREQKSDVPLLATFFSNFYSEEVGRRPKDFSAAAVTAMTTHDWPGNVRELANRVRRAQAMADGNQIQPADLGFEHALEQPRSYFGTLKDYLARAEREALEDVISAHRCNMSRAAKALGISRPTFYRLLHKHDILQPSIRNNAS